MKKELSKSKYDKHGRPIKKGLFSSIETNIQDKYSNLNNSYSSKKYIKEDKDIEEYKSNLSQKYDFLENKFKKENPILDEFGNELKSVSPEIAFYNILLVISFVLTGVGFFVAIFILIKISNKIRTKEMDSYRKIRSFSIIAMIYQLIISLILFPKYFFIF